MTAGRKRARFTFGLFATVLAAVASAPGRAEAHNSGRVELFITKEQVVRTDGGTEVSVRLVDRDSALPAPGFRVVASGVSRAGASVGPVTLEEVAGKAALYRTVLPMSPGEWTLKLESQQGDSSLPAVSSSKRLDVEVDEFGNVALRRSDRASGVKIALTVTAVLAGAAAVAILLLRRHRPAAMGDPAEGEPVAADPARAVRSR